MSELSPELEELVWACKSANLPTEADSTRVLAALRVRLGDAAVLGAEASQAAATSASSGLLFGKVPAMSLAGLALLGGIWLFAARNHRDESPSRDSAASVVTTSSSVQIVSASSAAPPSTATRVDTDRTEASTAPERVESRPAAPAAHNRDRLAEEVALLSRAEMALRSGKPAVALDVLNEHERRFGNGLLVEERIAARVQALCALGRKAEADAQLARLSPKSLHGAQPGQACAGRKND